MNRRMGLGNREFSAQDQVNGLYEKSFTSMTVVVTLRADFLATDFGFGDDTRSYSTRLYPEGPCAISNFCFGCCDTLTVDPLCQLLHFLQLRLFVFHRSLRVRSHITTFLDHRNLTIVFELHTVCRFDMGCLSSQHCQHEENRGHFLRFRLPGPNILAAFDSRINL